MHPKPRNIGKEVTKATVGCEMNISAEATKRELEKKQTLRLRDQLKLKSIGKENWKCTAEKDQLFVKIRKEIKKLLDDSQEDVDHSESQNECSDTAFETDHIAPTSNDTGNLVNRKLYIRQTEIQRIDIYRSSVLLSLPARKSRYKDHLLLSVEGGHETHEQQHVKENSTRAFYNQR
uniref:Uncharacterized protein n=1 Tax=Setaria digitata TaxID=48799 RepID=A0A915PKG5_9BILA